MVAFIDSDSMLKNINPKEHVFCTQQFKKDFIFELFELTMDIKKSPEKFTNELKNKIVALLFYESSTRTKISFESATLRMGGKIITTENATKISSAFKEESIEDTVCMLSNYSDFLIIRHFEDYICEQIAKKIEIPFINAGTGKTQHPTQSLLDLFTIYEHFGKLDNFDIALVGDLLRGRTCDSLIYLLSKFKGNNFFFVSADNCRIKEKLKEYLIDKKIEFSETDNLEKVLAKIDVCYMIRIQKERFSNKEEYKKLKGNFILDEENIEFMKENSIILHPLPRVDEISPKIDNDKRAKYFIQAKNGLYIRMALLKVMNDYNYN